MIPSARGLFAEAAKSPARVVSRFSDRGALQAGMAGMAVAVVGRRGRRAQESGRFPMRRAPCAIH